jgi:hypothetical protein
MPAEGMRVGILLMGRRGSLAARDTVSLTPTYLGQTYRWALPAALSLFSAPSGAGYIHYLLALIANA